MAFAPRFDWHVGNGIDQSIEEHITQPGAFLAPSPVVLGAIEDLDLGGGCNLHSSQALKSTFHFDSIKNEDSCMDVLGQAH